MRSIYIAFGANLGRPIESFQRAVEALNLRGVRLIAMSGLWGSPAWPPGQGSPDYKNACAQVEFDGDARDLLKIMHDVEANAGRQRGVLNAPRALDLDILDFRGQSIQADDIIVPHARMMNRGFVLFPLSQIAPNWIHPITSERVGDAIACLPLEDVMPMHYLGRQNFSLSLKKSGKIT